MPLADTLVYCVSCTCLFSCLQHCIVCARVCKCNVHGAPLSPGSLLHSPLVTLLPLAHWQYCALCAFSPGKSLLIHAHFAFCILLFCICTVFVFISRHKCTAVPWGRLLLQGALLQPSHRILHLIFPPLSLHLTFITSLRSIRRWSVYSENNNFLPSNRTMDFLPCRLAANT